MGYGLRYDYGIFRQEIENCRQVEYPDHWLKHPDPWEVARPREVVPVPIACTFRLEKGSLRVVPNIRSHLLRVPYDRPVVGYGGATINTLRLWTATSPEFFDFGEFSSGDFVGALIDRVAAETVNASPISRRFHSRRPGPALRSGIFPGFLFAGRHRDAISAHQ